MQNINNYRDALIQQMDKLSFDKKPINLYAPLSYFLSLGGKKTRPTLTLMGCSLFGKPGIKALNAAIAVELFHNFSLIHDDIMDEAPLRRGNKTVHEKWNINTAILSGDVLFVKAYQYLANNEAKYLPGLLAVFSKTAVEVCEGQQLDMDFETRNDVSIEEYIEMIRLKTSVLLGGALQLGAIIGEANEEQQRHIYEFGEKIGIAFQLQDDYLDLFGDAENFGKQIGGDIIANKKTFLLLKSFEMSNQTQRERLNEMMNMTDELKKVETAIAIFQEIGVDKIAKELMQQYYLDAKTALKKIDVPEENKVDLINLGKYIIEREI